VAAFSPSPLAGTFNSLGRRISAAASGSVHPPPRVLVHCASASASARAHPGGLTVSPPLRAAGRLACSQPRYHAGESWPAPGLLKALGPLCSASRGRRPEPKADCCVPCGMQTVALFGLGGPAAASGKYPIIADEDVMKQKAHGTSEKPVMKNLKWGADYEVPPIASPHVVHGLGIAWAETDA
jgi:hypothetical protein